MKEPRKSRRPHCVSTRNYGGKKKRSLTEKRNRSLVKTKDPAADKGGRTCQASRYTWASKSLMRSFPEGTSWARSTTL